jgi:hypothetical protein
MNKGENPITYLHYFVYGNDFNLSYNSDINKDKILIKWACENDNAYCKELVIFQNGQKINDIPFEKGNQALIVYYNNRMIGGLNQNKTIKTQAHQYNIKLESVSEFITLNAEIIGPAASKISENISITDFILAKQ